jgi:hypothetical protein
MAQVDAIKAIITADDAQFQEALKRTSFSIGKLDVDMAKIAKGVAAFGAAATAAAAAVLKLANEGIQLADQSAKTARSLGITSRELEGFRFAAQQSGISTSALDQSLKQFTIRLGDALKGTGETADAFRKLGLDAETLSRMPLEQAMGKVADALDGVTNQAERARVATQVFGRQGVEMTRMLEGGSSALNELTAESRRFGVTLTDYQIRGIEEATNAQGRLSTSLNGLKMQLGAELAPTITDMTDRMANFTAAMTNTIPVFLDFIRGILGIKKAVDQTSLVELENQLDRAQKKLQFFIDRPALRVLLSADMNQLMTDVGLLELDIEALRENMEKPFELPQISLENFIPNDEVLLEEQERIRSHFVALEEIQVDAQRRRRDLDEEYYDLKRRQEERAAENEARMRANSIASTRSNFGQAFSLLSQHSKKMFALQKAYAISDAIVSAYQGISKTLAAYPYPLSAAMAASQAALAFAQVASIKSQQFGTGGGGTGVAAAGGGAAAAAPMAPQQPQQTLTVRGIDANTLVAGADVRILAERLLDYQRDGGRVVFA